MICPLCKEFGKEEIPLQDGTCPTCGYAKSTHPLADTDDNIDQEDRDRERSERGYEDHMTDLSNRLL